MIIALHKPYGVLSQFNENPDKMGQKTLAAFGIPSGFSPIGRLDMDSEGLLLLSDDPSTEHQLLSPNRKHRRTYLVQVDGALNSESIQKMADGGLLIRSYKTLPCEAQIISPPLLLEERIVPIDPAANARSSWMKLTLFEGKNRQVRRMTAKVGLPTIRLYRLSIGGYQMQNMKPGTWTYLNKVEEKLLFK